MSVNNDIQKTITALGAIELIRSHYASSPQSYELIEGVLECLGSNSLFVSNMRIAIGASLSNKELLVVERGKGTTPGASAV